MLKQVGNKFYLNDKEIIRVTELLQKHGLGADYSFVDEEVLKRAADFGNREHANFENYFKGELPFENLPNLTKTGIKELEENHISIVGSEYRLHNEITTGQIDIIGLVRNQYCLIDIKTTSTLMTNVVSWQLSIYSYLVRKVLNIPIKRLFVLWLNKYSGVYELKEVSIIQDSAIERLFASELNGLNYSEIIDGEIVALANQVKVQSIIEAVAGAKEYLKELEIELDLMTSGIQTEMEKYGVGSFEIGKHRVTYVRPTNTLKIDYKKFIADNELEIPEEYQKVNKRKGYLKITEVKE